MSHLYGAYEDGAMPSSALPPHGSRLIPLEPPGKLDPQEQLAFRQLVDTIIDCYMIGRGRWRHFKPSKWHGDADAERIYESACTHTIDWINSDRFAFYLKYFGYGTLARARTMLCEILNGAHREEVERLMESPRNPTGKGGFTAQGDYDDDAS